jgi:ribonuclease BN (tRNA processing enzyme)
MKLTVIGYWGAYPEANEATSGYLVQHNGKNILIDCGSGVLSKVQNYINIEDLDAVVLSHYHADHMGDIYPLQYAIMILRHMGTRQKNLKVYALGNDRKFETLNYGNSCIAYSVTPGLSTDIEGLKFSFAKTVHPVPCVGMRIEDETGIIAYTADSQWSNSLIELSRNSDFLLCECNLQNKQKGVVTGHLTAGEAGTIAASANAKNLVLTHLPHIIDHNILVAEANAKFKGKITLAYTGLVLDTEL